MSAAPSSRPRPPSSRPLAAPGGAGSRSGGGSRSRAAGALAAGSSEPLRPSRALSPRPRGVGPRESPAVPRQPPGPPAGPGRHRGHVLPGQEEHPAHHGKPPARPPLCGVGVVTAGPDPPGKVGAAPRVSATQRLGRGGSRIAAPSPQPRGTMGGGARSAGGRGGAGG